jgi:hypothetical protein
MREWKSVATTEKNDAGRLPNIKLYFIKLFATFVASKALAWSDMNMRTFRTGKLDQPLAQTDAVAFVAEYERPNQSTNKGWRSRVAELLRPFADCASVLV